MSLIKIKQNRCFAVPVVRGMASLITILLCTGAGIIDSLSGLTLFVSGVFGGYAVQCRRNRCISEVKSFAINHQSETQRLHNYANPLASIPHKVFPFWARQIETSFTQTVSYC